MGNYTTIEKKVKEFDVLISDDPGVWYDAGFPDDNLEHKNALRVYCKSGNYWATFIISKMMLAVPDKMDDFIHRMLTRQFKKLLPYAASNTGQTP